VGSAVDLNADLGECVPGMAPDHDDAVLASVSTAHIACGFHAGGPLTMYATTRAAAIRGVAVGAHPSFPDRAGFGRRAMRLDQEQVRLDVVYQVAALAGIARALKTAVVSVKPHGALYNQMAVDPAYATAVVRGVKDFSADLWLVAPAGSVAAAVGESEGLAVAEEAFCDRGYQADGTLVPRGNEGAMLTDAEEVARRAVAIVRDGGVTAVDGSWVAMHPSTLCIHGDTPGAPAIAARVGAALEAAGIAVRPFSLR
jgi:5-oxoprolinase (ATP-hydrolysing) subunit A